MPNALVYIALFSWPLVVVWLFRRLPLPQALIWSVLGGYLLLPPSVGVDLPLLPALNKESIPSLAAALMCVIADRRERREQRRGGPGGAAPAEGRSRGSLLIIGLVALLVAAPFLTVLANRDPIVTGSLYLPGLRLYDAFSMVLGAGISILPFLLARRHLASPEAHRAVLRALCLAGLAYSLPALFEVRMSPQLNTWIYGYFPHSFAQQMRDGGFRPVVFLGHGLLVALFFSLTVVAGAILARQATGRERRLWTLATLWLLMTLVLCKTLGALAVSVMLLPIALILGARLQMLAAALIAGAVLIYPMLRGSGMVPTERISEFAADISADRAQSLGVRLHNEDILLAKANQRPAFGWGSWGRNRVYNERGRDISITDGFWIITIGTKGWIGYIATFGLLTLPLLLLALRRRRLQLGVASVGLCLVLAANLIDLIPNSGLSPLTWLLAGALAGRYGFVRAENPEAEVEEPVPGLRYSRFGPRASPATG